MGLLDKLEAQLQGAETRLRVDSRETLREWAVNQERRQSEGITRCSAYTLIRRPRAHKYHVCSLLLPAGHPNNPAFGHGRYAVTECGWFYGIDYEDEIRCRSIPAIQIVDWAHSICRECYARALRKTQIHEAERRIPMLYLVAVVSKPKDGDEKLNWGPEPVLAESEKMAEYAAIAAMQKSGKKLSEEMDVLICRFISARACR